MKPLQFLCAEYINNNNISTCNLNYQCKLFINDFKDCKRPSYLLQIIERGYYYPFEIYYKYYQKIFIIHILNKAIQFQNLEVIKFITDNNKNNFDITYNIHSLVLYACEVGNLDIVKCLVTCNKDCNPMIGQSQSFLEAATENNHLHIIKYFYELFENKNNFLIKKLYSVHSDYIEITCLRNGKSVGVMFIHVYRLICIAYNKDYQNIINFYYKDYQTNLISFGKSL